MSRLDRLPRLMGSQRDASNPAHHASVSASAGTGKTHVLTARVLRLLLSGVDPSSILCLTFTKAGAAEMAERLNGRLADWVRLPGNKLSRDLFALGEANDEAAQARARTLFAGVIDATGGGLRIQTIHAFAQGLLAAFPVEAGILPGFSPLDERVEAQLARATLAEMLVEAERDGDADLLRDVESMSHRLGEAEAEKMLMACARAPEAMAAFGDRALIALRLRDAFGVPDGDIEAELAAQCHDDRFDLETLSRVAEANAAWATKTGLGHADAIADWRSLPIEARARTLHAIRDVVHTQKGTVRASSGQARIDPDYADHAARLGDACSALIDLRVKAGLVDQFASAMRAGQAFAERYGTAKRQGGYVDFDDLIRGAENLLLQPDIGDWVRYKLDQNTDHILVDEAQDTNAAQWNIVRALTGEFFAGQGAVRRHRTLFTVGDYKQAIFSFQGTDPAAFERARSEFEHAAVNARDIALEEDVPADELPPRFLDLSLDTSFRSSPPVLAIVDRLLEDLAPEGLGLPHPAPPHDSVHAGRSGSVTVWPPVVAMGEDDEDQDDEEGWIGDATRKLADKIACQVAAWLAEGAPLESRGGRRVRPEDILILVRNRGTLASLLVARLLGEGVPVAGVDRLRLDAPLAVRDLLAAARFAVQPLDDLNLASLLVSPLFGLTQDALQELAYGRDGPLWSRIRERDEAVADALREILAMADYAGPHAFFETLLSGPLDGRRKLLARLGPAARDPIDELLSSALDFEEEQASSLDAFIAWFSSGEISIKRDPSAPLDAVRVMTVHGAKGLQSPIVILADATSDPDARRDTSIDFDHPQIGTIPLFRPSKDQLFEPLKSQAEMQAVRDTQEHARLLYVALTRAEEHLYVGGALGPRAKGTPPETSWYAPVDRAAAALGAEWEHDALWVRRRRYAGDEAPAIVPARERKATIVPAIEPPVWLQRPAPPEARPPRPLVPSALVDDAADPPPTPGMRAAAVRGTLLHALFERLPGVAPDTRRAAGEAWLSGSAGITDPAQRRALLDDALRIIEDPAYVALFGPDALAEAPLTAILPDGIVVTGTVDRLLVDETRVRVVDFKTGRVVPATAADIPPAYLRQMRAYMSALAVIFPGHAVDASLLFTSGPALFAVEGGVAVDAG